MKAPEKELSDKEIANMAGAEFKTLVIRILTEMVKYGLKTEEKVKAMQSEIKKNTQGTNTDRKETRTQINNLEQEKERNTQPEKNEEKEFRKMRRGLGTSRTS